MGRKIEPIHPKFWKRGQKVFDKNGIEYDILDTCERAGVFYATLSRVDIKKAHFVVFDCHPYSVDGADPLPEYYRKSPKRKIR